MITELFLNRSGYGGTWHKLGSGTMEQCEAHAIAYRERNPGSYALGIRQTNVDGTCQWIKEKMWKQLTIAELLGQ